MSDVIITTVYPDGTREERAATPEEIAEMQESKRVAQEEQARMESELAAREAARESALAKLAALGLTEEEAAAIIG